MPVYDNNGTTSTQIGKVYDNNGTTSTQIGKVYDNNGTTSSLIYEALIAYYPGYTVQGAQSGGSWGSFYANASNSNGGWARAYLTVNLTGISSIKITYTYSCGTYAQVFIGVCSAFDVNVSTMQSNSRIKKTAVAKTSVGTSSASNQTATLNVSDLSGNYYVGILSYSGSVADAVVTASISAITQVS